MAMSDMECLTNIQPTSHGIIVTLPDGSRIRSTHTALLDMPALPPAACVAHLFPGLVGSLLSIGVLCDHGCQALYDAACVTITRNGEVVLSGTRSAATHNLWMVDLQQADTDTSIKWTAAALSAAPRTQQLLVAFFHACLCSPTLSTFIEAIKRKFVSFPGLTEALARKYSPASIATAKGHLTQTPAGLRSTKADAELDDWYPVPADTRGESSSHSARQAANVFARVSRIKPLTGRHDIDATGRLPVASVAGNQYVLVMFCEDENYIHTEPLRKRVRQGLQGWHRILPQQGHRSVTRRAGQRDVQTAGAFLRHAEPASRYAVCPARHSQGEQG